MKRSHLGWYGLLIALTVMPLGVRSLASALRHRRPPRFDGDMAQAGQMLFNHQWKVKDPLSRGGDGLGPVFNADSCVACHNQGGVGGGGGVEHNVTTFTVRSEDGRHKGREGVVHARATAPQFLETLQQVDGRLPAISQPGLAQVVTVSSGIVSKRPVGNRDAFSIPNGVHISQRNTPALFGAQLIDELPDSAIIASERKERLAHGLAGADSETLPIGRALRLANGRVGKFGWKAQTASLGDFVRAACANELGLGNPGQAQPRPLNGMNYQPPGLDLTDEQCDQLTAFIQALPRPVEVVPAGAVERDQAEQGKRLFHQVGCADCHTPNVGSVEGIYSDLLVHRMGQDLVGGGSYNEPPVPLPDFEPSEGPQPGEWRTPPLWGVADSAPYLHDGRAPTLQDAIFQHGGQAAASAKRFGLLGPTDQAKVIVFLKTLRAPQSAAARTRLALASARN